MGYDNITAKHVLMFLQQQRLVVFE